MTRRPVQSDHDEPMSMTPLIDVTFLLLVFFMCTLQFKTLEGKLSAYLPKGVGDRPDEALEIEEVRVTIRVLTAGTRLTREGTPLVEGVRTWAFSVDRTLEYRVGPMRTQSLAELGARLTRLHRAHPDRPLSIAPHAVGPGIGTDDDAGVTHGEALQVVDLGIDAGLVEIRFAAGR